MVDQQKAAYLPSACSQMEKAHPHHHTDDTDEPQDVTQEGWLPRDGESLVNGAEVLLGCMWLWR